MPTSTLDEERKLRAQMPLALRAAADKNLAAEDASLSRVNTAFNPAGQFEGYARVAQYQEPGTEAATRYPSTAGKIDYNAGTVSPGGVPVAVRPSGDVTLNGFQPSTPTADVLRANRSVPDLITGALEGRRQALAEGIANKRDPDAPALFVTPKRHALMVAELNAISDVAHQHAFETAHTTKEAFEQQQDIESAKQFTNLANEIAGIKAPLGTPEHEQAVLRAAARNSLGAMSTAGQKLLTTHSSAHDATAKLLPADKNYWARFQQTYKDASEFGRPFGVSVQYDKEGFPSLEMTRTEAEKAGPIAKTVDKPNPAYIKIVDELATAKADKNAAYNSDKKANLSTHDAKIAKIQNRLDAVREALGIKGDGEPKKLSTEDQKALDWSNANSKDERAVKIKQRLGIN